MFVFPFPPLPSLCVSGEGLYTTFLLWSLCLSLCLGDAHTDTHPPPCPCLSLSVWDTHRQKERHIEKGDKSDRPPSVRHTTHSALFLGRSPFPFSLVVCWKERPGWGEKGGFGLSCCPVKYMSVFAPPLVTTYRKVEQDREGVFRSLDREGLSLIPP